VGFPSSAGVGGYQKTIACRLLLDPTGQQMDGLISLQKCWTMTQDLLASSDWLAAVEIGAG
jgi:hypothetical protein